MSPIPVPRAQDDPRPLVRSRPGAWLSAHGSFLRAAAVAIAPLIIAAVSGLALLAFGGESGKNGGLPTRTPDLFQLDKVWSLHLRFTPEAWAAMEPPAPKSPFPPGMGLGMFLTPLVMRDGDQDHSGSLSTDEFRKLGQRWFAAWDEDGDGIVDAKQLRAGLKRLLRPPAGAEGGPPPGAGGGPPPFELNLQGRKGQRNGLAAIMGIDFKYVHADLEFEGRTFPDVAVRYKGNGTFMASRGSLKRSLKIDLNKYVKGQKLAGVTTLNLHNNVTDAGMMNEPIAYQLFRDADVPAPRTAYARVFVTVPGKHDRKYFGLYSLVENVDKHFLADRKLGPGGAIYKPTTQNVFHDLGGDWDSYEQTYDPKTDLSEAQRRRVIEFSRLITHGTDAEVAAHLGEFLDLDEFARFLAVTVWIGDPDSILNNGQNYYVYLAPTTDRFQFIPWDKDLTFGAGSPGGPEAGIHQSIREPWGGRKRFLERVFRVEAFRERYLAALAKFAAENARPEQIQQYVSEVATAIRPAIQEESAEKLSRFETVAAGKPLAGSPFSFGKPTPTLLMFVKARAASVQDQLAGRSEGFVLGKPMPGGPKMPPGPPPFEEMLGGPLLKALDGDKDGNLTRDEVLDGFGKWFASWDTQQAGTLSADQVRKGLNRSLPFPFFGPPPGGPPRPKDAKRPNGENGAGGTGS